MRAKMLFLAAFLAVFVVRCGHDQDTGLGPDSDFSIQGESRAPFAPKMISGMNFPLRMMDYNKSIYTSGGVDSVLVRNSVGMLLASGTSKADSSGIFWSSITIFPGDFNCDGMVDFADFFLFADSFDKSVQSIGLLNMPIDMDSDGRVDFSDFFLFVDSFGASLDVAGKLIFGSVSVSAEDSVRVSAMDGIMSYAGWALIALANGEIQAESVLETVSEEAGVEIDFRPAPKVAVLTTIPLKISVFSGRRFVRIDTTITRDWIAISSYYQDASMPGDLKDVIELFVRAAPYVSKTAPTIRTIGAGVVEKIRLGDIFQDDSQLSYSITSTPIMPIPGVRLNGNLLEISFVDSSAKDFDLSVSATDKDSLVSVYSFHLHRPRVTKVTELVFSDTLRIGSPIIPIVREATYWDGILYSEMLTPDTTSTIVGIPGANSLPGVYTIVLLRPQGALSTQVVVYPAREDDFLRIARLNADIPNDKVSIRLESGYFEVRVSLSLNGNSIFNSNVSVVGDSVGMSLPVTYIGNSTNVLSLVVTDIFGNRVSKSLSVPVGDLVPPQIFVMDRTPQGIVSVGSDGRVIWGLKALDNVAINPTSRNIILSSHTVRALDQNGTILGSTSFGLGSISVGNDTLEAWGYFNIPTTTSPREVTLLLKVVDLAGNIAESDIMLWQPSGSIGALVSYEPEISVAPVSLSLSALIGSSIGGTVTVYNSGNIALSVSGISVLGAGFSVTQSSMSVPAGGTNNITVLFAPISAGVINGSLVIVSNDSDEGTVVIPLVGTGTVPGGSPGSPEISLAPTSIVLTSQIGATTTGQVIVSNIGNANLALYSASITDPTLSVAPSSTTVAPGSSVAIVVTFSPNFVGSINRVLTITSNDADEGTVNVNVSATGTAIPGGAISVSPTSLPYGTVGAGQTSVKTVTVSNTGINSLNVKMPMIKSAFSVSASDTAFILSSGSSRSIAVTFAPTSGIVYSGVFNITSNDPSNPSVILSTVGTGVTSQLTMVTSQLNFGSVAVFGSSSQKIEFRNSGNQTLTGTVSTSNNVFGLSSGSISVAPGATDSVFVTFSPSAVQSYAETISFFTDGGNATVPVIGTGLAVSAPNIVSATIAGTLYQNGDNFTVPVPAGVFAVSANVQNASSITWSRIYMSGLTQMEEVILNGSSGTINPYNGVTGLVVLKITAIGAGTDILRINLNQVGAP